ncbi:MAG: TonB-dependent receptor [Gammaproteobacteria bacterium]|nr:TonB-dependent receptor [Gammaproteobacteria bacterium]
MKSFRVLLTTVCAIALPISSLADLGPIVITPTRTEQAQNNSSATVYVLTSEAIESSGATTTSELLRGIPGVQIDDLFGNGTQANISVRGFSSTANANTLVLVNGRRLNNSDTASPDIHHVFPKDIERVEVLVGSAGSLYGDQAVGGVINIITKSPTESRHRVSTRLGSFDYRGIQFNSSMKLSESLGYRLSAEKFETDHYRDHNAEENSNFNGMLEYSRDDDNFFVEVQKIEDKLELPGALIEAEYEEDRKQINPGFVDDFINEDTDVYRIGYERSFGRHNFSIDATSRETDADVRQSFRDTPSPENGSIDRKHEAINPKFSGIIRAGFDTPYVIGIDLERTDFDLEIPNQFFTTESSSEQKIDSLYFQVMPYLTKTLQLTFGMRSSSLENDLDYLDALSTQVNTEVEDDVTVAELGLSYLLDDQTRLTFRYDENFRFAKIDEFQQTEAPTILDTQTGESFEIGIDITRGDQWVILSIYQLDLQDEIEFDPTLGPDFGFGPIGLNTNLDKTRRQGLTLSWLSQISRDFTLKTELGLVDAKFESGVFKGNDISGVADEIVKIRGDYQITNFIVTYLEVNYTSPMHAQGDNANQSDKIDSVTVINAGVGYQNKAWDVSFRINNLADEEYADFITNFGFGAAYQPSPERNFMLTAGYSFE